jgi:hypothetical protein
MSERIGKISTIISVGAGAEIEDYLRVISGRCNLSFDCKIKVGWFLEKGTFTVRGKESDLAKFKRIFLAKIAQVNREIETGEAYER